MPIETVAHPAPATKHRLYELPPATNQLVTSDVSGRYNDYRQSGPRDGLMESNGSTSTSESTDGEERESKETLIPAMILSSLFGPLPSISRGAVNLAIDLYRSSPARQLKKHLRKQIGATPRNLSEIMTNLVAECDLYAYQERLVGAWWNRSFYLLGAPAAVLATIAGTTSLSDAVKPIVVTVLALCSAALTTLVTFLKDDNKHDRHLQSSAAWTNLADRARILILDYGSATSKPGSTDDWVSGSVRQQRKCLLTCDDEGC